MALAETLREISCLNPWCVCAVRDSVSCSGQNIRAMVLYFGKKDSWEYADLRRLIAERLQSADQTDIDEAFVSYTSFLTFLGK